MSLSTLAYVFDYCLYIGIFFRPEAVGCSSVMRLQMDKR